MHQPSALSEQVTEAIERVVRQEMGDYGLLTVRAAPGLDHDGDQVIWVHADYRIEGPPVDPKKMAGLVSKIRGALYEADEVRFPHVRHHFSKDRQVVGYK